MKNYKILLENSDLKTTPQRLAILKELDSKGHASIEEIYEDIKEMFPSISLATIYKNINALKEEKIISEICLHQKPKFEITKDPHAHFICKKCGKVVDIPMDELLRPEMNEKYSDSEKELYIYGICEECKDGNS
ncbi:Fur family transcriptional regulator [Caminibacter pacificus]|uniref:Fur family ferric uptake transcriptional regulator/Fur family peroxide stress response transcriptional regulator n=1 Tax=Caminibacter pacificus TaxID=1424653 RepID=A0AAJ4RC19_9BACT|nr:transcriptional repressor [Caminibacter pacificus]NPA88409.1 transcriptional repressor [Campylobacterota bacterium]QCI28781.1 transcriptional repressor [Caminibacter pacificus]ROR39369.1 Fur family ferric uptake transcriptional regulator/Fur family peroxide stress response transcriptional regulator [Caminibacter pacificus]